MVINSSAIEKMPLDGGILCLDFVNSVHDRKKAPLKDYFSNAGDILMWGKRAGIVNESSFGILAKKIDSGTQDLTGFHKKAIELRELLYGIFLKIVRRSGILQSELTSFNEFLSSYFNAVTVKFENGNFFESWKWKGEDLNRILLSVIKSSHELMLSGRLDRVKECPNCGWLFLDTTKNGKRKWCSMKSCGSGVKALDYYYRKKKTNKNKQGS